MKSSPAHVNGWSQQSLIGPEAVHIEVTLTWERATGCRRVGLLVKNVDDDSVMAMWSKPLTHTLTPAELAIVVASLLAESFTEHCDPF